MRQPCNGPHTTNRLLKNFFGPQAKTSPVLFFLPLEDRSVTKQKQILWEIPWSPDEGW